MFRYFFTQITTTVLVCLLISSFVLVFFFVNFWKTDIFSGLNNQARGIEQSLRIIETEKREDDIPDSAVISLSYASSSEVYVVDSDGRTLLCRDMKKDGNDGDLYCEKHSGIVINEEVMAEIILSGDECQYEGKIPCYGEGNYFLAAVKINVADNLPLYVIVAENSNEAYQPYTTEFVRMIIATGIIAVIFSFFASIAVSYRMSKPIKKITDATKHYAGGDFSVKIPDMHSYTELESLIDSVNSMADSLSVLEESRSNFVANVSHELKTPMTIISGFVDGILDGTIDGNDREKYLNIVSDEVKRLSRLVVAMLNMSKIEAGKLTLKRSDVNLQRMIFSILITFEKVIDEKKINIAGLDTLENVTIDADDALINQVLYNIMDNAVKFTPQSGTISFALESDKKFAEITIRNTGTGISKEDASLIFDRFYKVDKSRGLDSHSFGMGLFIVRSIVELHGGTISLDSEVGQFTQFNIRLPM